MNNTRVTADKVNLSASTAYALTICGDNSGSSDGNWVTNYKFTGTENLNLVPVSTTGKLNIQQGFDFVKAAGWAVETGAGNAQAGQQTVNKFAAADYNDTTKDYWTETFHIKASQSCKLYLDDTTVFLAAEDSVTGTLNKVLRLGLVFDDGTNQKQFIYQIDPVQDNGTVRYNTTLVSYAADGVQKAIQDLGTSGEGTAASIMSNGQNVTSDIKAVAGTNAAIITGNDAGLATVAGDSTADLLYTFNNANDEVKVTAYLWMEGCDYDCTNDTISTLTGVNTSNKPYKISATLGFCAAA